MKSGVVAIILALLMLVAGPVFADDDESATRDMQTCIRHRESEACERACFWLISYKARVKAAVRASGNGTSAQIEMSAAIADVTGDAVGQQLSVVELLFLIQFEEFGTAHIVAENAVLTCHGGRAYVTEWLQRAARAGSTAMQYGANTSFVSRSKARMREAFRNDRDLYRMSITRGICK
jgi:hypothetical protein